MIVQGAEPWRCGERQSEEEEEVKMRKVVLGVAVLGVVVCTLLAGCEGGSKSPIVAKVGSERITLEDLQARMPKREFRSEGEELNAKKSTLDAMIEEKLLLMEARERGLHEDEELKRNIEDLEKDAAIKQMYNELIVEQIEATDEDARLMWEKLGEEAKASVITSQTLEDAEQILKDLKAGGNFEDIARERSVDQRSAPKGGDLGWLTWDAYSDEFSEALFGLQPGELSDIVEVAGFYQIIRLDERREVEQKDFEEEKEQLKEKVTMRMRASEAQKFLDGLEEGANITFDDETLSWLETEARELTPTGGGVPQFSPEDQKKIIVRFSGTEWPIEEVLRRFGPRTPPFSDVETVKNGVQGLVMAELLWREARRRGIHKQESVQESVNSRVETRLVQTMRRESSEMVQDVPEEELRAYYDEHKDQYPNREFEEAKSRIRMRLTQEKRKNAEAEFINGLKEKYQIEIIEENLLAKAEPEEGEE